jgi:hypothetical protein
VIAALIEDPMITVATTREEPLVAALLGHFAPF